MAREHCGQQRDTTIGSPPMPTLTLVAERTPLRAYDLNGVVINIGRGDDMDVVIDNPSVSRRQAQVRLDSDGRWIVEDLKSANGTSLNGRSEEHTSELQSQSNLVCRLLLEKKKKYKRASIQLVVR